MADQDFQRLLELISKTTLQVERLGTRIADLQKRMQAGDLGTDQIRKLNTQIERLQANLSEKRTTQASLINQKEILESTRGFDTLAKTIDTTQKRLNELYAKRGTGADPLGIEAQIKKYEAALSSFQSRMNKQFTAFGTRRTGNEPTTFGEVDLEGRLKGVGAPSVRELGRTAALKAIDDIQNQILQGAIDARLAAAASTHRVEAAATGFLRRQNQPQSFVSKIFPELYGAQTTAANPLIHEIPHPTPEVTRNQSINDQLEQQTEAKFLQGLGRLSEAINLTAADLLARKGLTGGATTRYLKAVSPQAVQADELENARVREERLALESTRNKILTEKRYADVLKIATQRGFSLEDLKFARSKGTAGIEEFRFANRDAYGIQRQLDLFNTPGGKTTAGISNQFRTFGQGVLRDIGEFTKWSIALAAVYGPMRKLQELTQIMIDNQTRLAEASITVSSAFLDQGKIFDVAADSAERAGESIGGVIDAFTQAYRATGGAGDQVERLTVAQKLLNDSLILSKLSTLDQASAIDTLSAALRQSARSNETSSQALSNGTDLLDKWVRVTKIANIDMSSLATGFAVLGDAAEAAGISTDQLNGVLAAIAETGVASGRELANTARAIVAGFQSDQSRKALESIGVAVTDTAGKMRPFLEIMQQLSDLRKSGVIDDTTFSKLTLILGGGTRRQAAYATFIENFGRVGQVAAESARASGDAQAALAKQLETVQTSLTRLGNAFQELAQTLGTEGGFLGIITKGVDNMTALVKVFDSLTSVLGKATPALAAFIATSLILKARGQGGLQDVLLGKGAGLERDPELLRLAQVTGYRGAVPALGGGRQFLQNNVLGTNVLSGAIQGLVLSAIPAIMNATNKEDRYGRVKAGADIVGGIGGAIVGSLVAGSPIIGAAVGTAISEAFINATVARKTDIYGYGPATLGPAQKGPTTTEDLDKRLKDAEANLYKSIGFGNEGLGKLIATPSRGTQNIYEGINKAITARDEQEFNRLIAEYGDKFFQRTSGLSIAQIKQAYAEKQPIQFNPQTIAYNLASDQARREYDAARSARVARGDVAGQVTSFSNLVAQNNKIYESLLNSIKESSKRELSQERVAGKVTGAEYAKRAVALSDLNVSAIQYYTALGDKVNQLSHGTKDAAKQFEVLNNVIVKGGDETLPAITSLTAEIQTLVNLLADPKLNATTLLTDFGGADKARKKLEELRGTLLSIIKDTNDQVLLQNFKFPEIVGDYTKPKTRDESRMIYERGVKIQEDYLNSTGATREQIEAFKKSIEDFKTPVKEAGSILFDTVSGLEQRFYSLAEASLTAEGALKSLENFDIQKLDINSQQGAGLQGQIDYFSRYLAKNFPQYQQKPEDFGVIFNDYVTQVLHGDNLAVKLALDKLVDINQKQLDGMYNIPEGATFWVPLTAAYYRPKNEGAGGGLPPVDAQAVTGNTSATDRNTSALDNLSGVLSVRAFGTEQAARYPAEFRHPEGTIAGATQATLRRKSEEAGYGIPPRFAPPSEATAMRKSEEAGFGTGTMGTRATGFENFIQNLLNTLRNIFSQPGVGGPPGKGYGGGADTTGFRGFSAATPQQAQPVNAKIEMRIDNRTQLMVDGRVLASVITPYLSSDLLKLEASQGTIVKRYVI